MAPDVGFHQKKFGIIEMINNFLVTDSFRAIFYFIVLVTFRANVKNMSIIELNDMA